MLRREDRMMMHRGMDENADNMPEADNADRNHKFKLDAKQPETTITINRSSRRLLQDLHRQRHMEGNSDHRRGPEWGLRFESA